MYRRGGGSGGVEMSVTWLTDPFLRRVMTTGFSRLWRAML